MFQHESQLIQAFIRPDRRRRWIELLQAKHGRRKLRARLAHCETNFDERFVHQISECQQSRDAILVLLRESGACESCYALSEDDEIDGCELPLTEALDHVMGRGLGTFLLIHPGRLAYFEGESMHARYVCVRPARSGS